MVHLGTRADRTVCRVWRTSDAICRFEKELNTDERIRRRAHELYEQRGRFEGFAVEDWLQAETEILGRQKPSKTKEAKRSK